MQLTYNLIKLEVTHDRIISMIHEGYFSYVY